MPSTNSAETCNQEFVSLKRSRSANGAQLTKLYNELEKSMMSYNNIEEVKLLNNRLCERFEHFKSVHLQCLDLCAQPEVVADLEANFESCLKNFEEFRERFSQWIAGAIGPQDGENIPLENDAESNVSHGSSRTSVSSRRKLQSAKAKRLIAEHKLKQLKKKQELERARRDLEMKQQLLDQQSELEEAEIEEMVLLETTQEETGVISNNQNAQPDVQNNMTNHIQVNNRTDSVRNITLTQPRPEINRSCIPEVDSETSNIDRSFQRLASALHEGFNLPKPELLTFDGKPEGYCKFIKNFETNIESRISDNNLKLSYLIQYCTEIIADKGESQTAAVIVGVVLGAIIVVLALYAIYATLVIRRYKKGEGENEINKSQTRKGPIYANETFKTGIAEIGGGNKEATSSNSETEYSRLDENTRDDKTYERLQDL